MAQASLISNFSLNLVIFTQVVDSNTMLSFEKLPLAANQTGKNITENENFEQYAQPLPFSNSDTEADLSERNLSENECDINSRIKKLKEDVVPDTALDTWILELTENKAFGKEISVIFDLFSEPDDILDMQKNEFEDILKNKFSWNESFVKVAGKKIIQISQKYSRKK